MSITKKQLYINKLMFDDQVILSNLNASANVFMYIQF